jgi:hypothetical protein
MYAELKLNGMNVLTVYAVEKIEVERADDCPFELPRIFKRGEMPLMLTWFDLVNVEYYGMDDNHEPTHAIIRAYDYGPADN